MFVSILCAAILSSDFDDETWSACTWAMVIGIVLLYWWSQKSTVIIQKLNEILQVNKKLLKVFVVAAYIGMRNTYFVTPINNVKINILRYIIQLLTVNYFLKEICHIASSHYSMR